MVLLETIFESPDKQNAAASKASVPSSRQIKSANMTTIKSLGIHKPTGLQTLIAEGVLPPDPPESLYRWETICDVTSDGTAVEEELLITDFHVVWSRGGSVRRLFSFAIEEQPVLHVAFTTFHDPGFEEGKSKKTDSGDVSERDQRNHSKQNGRTKSLPRETPQDGIPRKHAIPTVDTHQETKEYGGRALVIVLKIQAHVYFSSGASRIVTLPFDVESVHPFPFGILLQRKIHERSKRHAAPLVPTAPTNTFTFSQLGSSGSVPDTRGFRTSSDAKYNGFMTPAIENSWKTEVSGSESDNVILPRTFYLTDTLSSPGVAVAADKSQSSKNFKTEDFDPAETLLYVSPSSELASAPGNPESPPLAIALTSNLETGMYNLWSVFFSTGEPVRKIRARVSSLTSRVRRRSSHPPTGAQTPALRTSVGPRESFGGIRGVTAVNAKKVEPKKSAAIKLADEIEGEITLEEDTALNKPGRRISSLISRTELSTSTAFPEPAQAHQSLLRARRAPSSGNRTLRATSNDLEPNVRKATASASIGDSFRSSQGIIDGNLSDLSDSDDGFLGSSYREPPRRTRNLKREFVFQKIHSIQHESHLSIFPHAQKALKAFTLVPSTYNDENGTSELVVCLMDRELRRLTVLQIRVTRSTRSKATGASQPYNARVVDVKTGDGIIDACKVSEGECSRILVLGTSPDGFGELTLQAHWSSLLKIQLPKALLNCCPHDLNPRDEARHKREGGLKRILSNGPTALKALDHHPGTRLVNVVDQEGTQHRIEIYLLPMNRLVRQLIRVCELVLPYRSNERQPILRAFWDVTAWLRIRKAVVEKDLEWTAFVVLLFSMALGFINDRKTTTPVRQSRHQGPLLRSSSGANIDMTSFNEMLSRESKKADSWTQSSAWSWMFADDSGDKASSRLKQSPSSISAPRNLPLSIPKSPTLLDSKNLAREFAQSEAGQEALGANGYLPVTARNDSETRRVVLPTILIAIHLFREELKLDILAISQLHQMTPLLAQLGGWLDWESWGWMDSSYYMLESSNMGRSVFDKSRPLREWVIRQTIKPPSIFSHIENVRLGSKSPRFMTLVDLIIDSADWISRTGSPSSLEILKELTPRTMMVMEILKSESGDVVDLVKMLTQLSGDKLILETLPEGIAASLRGAIAACQLQANNTWSNSMLSLLDRDDIILLKEQAMHIRLPVKSSSSHSHEATRDVHTICLTALNPEEIPDHDEVESDRKSITRMIFKDDQRFAEVCNLTNPQLYPIVSCIPEPDWSDTDLLEAQQELVKIISLRTLSVSPGKSMLRYSACIPLITEKFQIKGFKSTCVMKPSNTTVTADKSLYSEEKVGWAFFHAGVDAGLSVSKLAEHINTSWILFNKPEQLNNRHAGFLMGLGLNGHLTGIATWAAFKYMTPKHSMTSIGMLLGLAASNLGTMDGLVTKSLAVHVMRMLPQDSVELNVEHLNQTAGIMGIGLCYYNSQHRRMSNLMVSEIENIEEDPTASPRNNLRDEGYRLAAGFALGLINLGHGNDLQGLHDMHVVERLLTIAVGTKKVELVHILDKATAGATIAFALIFMKTHNEGLARKIDIPDTVHQFEYVRPDIFLLRTLARHLIMWDNIKPTAAWMREQLPATYKPKVKLTSITILAIEDLPLLNIIAGLCFSLGLRYAGSGRLDVRNLLVHFLDQFMRICRLPAMNYDGKLTRITVRHCQDAVALAASCVMAGTGDLNIFRRLRSLHGRQDAETPYGSHLAAHLAMGVLFLGGGTYTFNTSNLAVASLLCAFYPLFPSTVHDNKCHLQAFRHFWVFAAEPRCLVVRDVDSCRPISIPIIVTLRPSASNDFKTDTQLALTSPCLLPELDTIATVTTTGSDYFPVTLDFAKNPDHLKAFKHHQSIYCRKRVAYDFHNSVFSATMHAINDAQLQSVLSTQVSSWIFDLPAFKSLDRAARALVIPPDGGASGHLMPLRKLIRGTPVDDRLALEKGTFESGRTERLWSLRVLFAWADNCKKRGVDVGWIGQEFIDEMRAGVWLKAREDV
ncbi:MAG: Anaphase-promoting complex subunit 1 [Icmadophila ericetorum]|nr:Anaphase-promoting complex subunit 1 [Icmadophila ericetorum]